uniref:Serine protease n=1 Tax=Candidatus Enterococcus clewellii TaxID=1834193 RepID=A0A242KDA5_9ENTE|nr:hypothetical protein [Enterococcus sp. 9E7_DIV0242]OTP19151.1 hypothetical protein A5888_000965 [Enterococcus sp. 9E7_DIV0242]
MKKSTVLVICVMVQILFSNNAYANSVDENVENNVPEQIDFSDSISSIRTRSGDQSIHIDGEQWDQTIKDAYKEKYPDYDGKVKIVDINDETNTEEISFEESFGELPLDGGNLLSRSFAGVPTTGTPNSSIGKVKLYWFLSNGVVKHASGTVFKVSDNVFGTAGHVVYDRANGYGWAGQGSILFGCTRSANGGINTKALYGVTSLSTNSAWTDTPDYHKAWGSDFGHIKAKLSFGTAPANLKLHTGTVPQSVSGTSYGYNGGVNEVSFSKAVGQLRTSTLFYGNIYEATWSIMPLRGGMSGGPVFDNSNLSLIHI